MPALIAGLGAHRLGGAQACAQHLPFGLVPEQHDQRAVGRIGQIDRSTGLRQPHRDAVGLQEGDDLQGLVADEGAFVLADHDRVEPAVRPGRRAEQFRGVRPLVPGQAA